MLSERWGEDDGEDLQAFRLTYYGEGDIREGDMSWSLLLFESQIRITMTTHREKAGDE